MADYIGGNMNLGIDIDDTLTNLQPIIFSNAQKYDYENFGGKSLKDPYGYDIFEMFSWENSEHAKFIDTYYMKYLEIWHLDHMQRQL